MTLSTPIEEVPRVGLIYQKRLKKMGIKTVEDLLFHFPRRYEDFSNIVPIAEVYPVRTQEKKLKNQPKLLRLSKGMKINQRYCIQGKILEIDTTRTWKKRMFLTQAIVEDKTGAMKVIWFNQPYLSNALKPDDYVCLAGEVSVGKDGAYLSNPAYEKISPRDSFPGTKLTHTGRIIPVYPETVGLSSRWLRYIIKPLLERLKDEIPEPLPEEIIKENKLLPIHQAIWQIHFPDSIKLSEKAQKRFSFEELFFIELFVLRERQKLNQKKSTAIPLNLKLIQRFVKILPFKLTNAQKKSSWQVLKDLEKSRPMSRLLEGDVGSGKTVVAVIACLNTIKAGYQAAFMAPTEILAKQHFQEVSKLLEDFKLNIALLTGKEDKWKSPKLKNENIEISRQKLLEKTMNGEMDILIGTHALIQDKVKFGKLGLVILDEQHRFGVEQRAKLSRQKDFIPHFLSMTATPIPRTLALTIYGDLDLSLIDEMPKGRKKIITQLIKDNERENAYDFIRKEAKSGRQIFVICPRIEKPEAKDKRSEKELYWADVKAVEEEFEKLSEKVFPELKVAMLHGKMKPKEKEKIMLDFKNKKTDILVSTSVIEVGIDVPNAAVMMIEGAERFGLAQLHQFRGRVGRSKTQSYCFLFTDSHAKKTFQRLKALMSSENGFELAEKDLEIRGPGDFSGVRQWGIPDLAMASLKNIHLVEKTRNSAKEILDQDPALKKHPLLLQKLGRFRERVHLE